MNTNSKVVMNSINNMMEIYHELADFGVTLDNLVVDGNSNWEKIGKKGFESDKDADKTLYVNNWMQSKFRASYKRTPGELLCVNVIFAGHWGVEIEEPLLLSVNCKLNKSLREDVIRRWAKTDVPLSLYYQTETFKKPQKVYTANDLLTSRSRKKLMDIEDWGESEFDEISSMKFVFSPLLELGNTGEIKEKILEPLGVFE